MEDRIHAWIEGDLPLEALTPAERAQARRVRDALDLIADSERAVGAGVADTVMARIADAPSPRPTLRDRFRAIIAGSIPATIPLRPAAALATVCLVLGFGVGVWAASSGEVATPTSAAEQPSVFVRFDLEVDGARTVHLAGSFSEWRPAYELTPSGANHWTVTVPLSPGVHDYVFVVDGERHVLDPAAPRIADGFGSYSNRIALLASST